MTSKLLRIAVLEVGNREEDLGIKLSPREYKLITMVLAGVAGMLEEICRNSESRVERLKHELSPG